MHRYPVVLDKHSCSYRQFTQDVPENRILKWTASLLRSWDYIDKGVFRRLHRILHTLGDVQLDPNSRFLFDRLEFHRLNDSYQPALAIAKIILDYLSFTGSAGSEPFLAFLIDMNVLFQQYLTVVLQQGINKSGFQVIKEESHFLDQGRQINIRPDLLLYKGIEPLLIIDAKYKTREAQEDLYQMIAYCHAINLNRAILVHPESDQSPIGTISMLGAGDISVCYLSLNLGGDPTQLNNQANLLVHEILEMVNTFDPIRENSEISL